MRLEANKDSFPLSPAMTRRVVTYLNIFRLAISIALMVAWAGGVLVESPQFSGTQWVAISLVIYLLAAVLIIYETRQEGMGIYRLAQASLLLDVVMIALLSYMFGGLTSGLAVLLIFTSTAAAVLLPMELALFIAALATFATIGDAVIGGILRSGHPENIIKAGFFGAILFVITTLAHLLARWAKDYRLTAERQMVSLTRLEQINELIIKRMRSGVLAIDQSGEIRMMNESAWFLLGSPEAANRVLIEVSPGLGSALDIWRADPRGVAEAVTLEASQAEVIPQFLDLPAGRGLSVLIFLEDNDIVARRAHELSAHSLAKLSSSIAHEIRNPLAAVSHAAQLLAENEEMDETDRRMVDIIQKQSVRMNGIIENILQIARREKSRPELVELDCWLTELSQEFNGANLEFPFTLKIAGDCKETLVMFDRSQLHQVLWKLMENALQHLGEDNQSPKLILRLEQEAAAGFCIISVEDNGTGIPEDKLGGIFEPFVTTRREGTGLGLYIARQLCESNQAELTVDSKPGRTRFHIRITLTAPLEHQPESVELASHD